MRIETLPDSPELALRAADLICETARANPAAVFGLPTGRTPLLAYAELERRVAAGEADFSRATAYAIDEFAGVPSSGAGTNSMFFRKHLRVPWPLHLPEAMAPDPDDEIAAFAGGIHRDGGFDLCILGIGANGHIAFNEPGSPRESRARVVDLADSTRRAHAAAFGSLDAVPHKGMTLGIADLLESKRIVVLASGAAKADIVARAIDGPVTANVPASWLQEVDALWLLDRAAASELKAVRR